MICAVCGRDSRGFCRLEREKLIYFCSTKCESVTELIDTTPNEQNAIKHGSELAVEYLCEIGIWDLSQVSHEQWLQLCECIVSGYCEEMQKYQLRETEFLMGLQK